MRRDGQMDECPLRKSRSFANEPKVLLGSLAEGTEKQLRLPNLSHMEETATRLLNLT